MLSAGILRGRGGVEPVDIGEEHQQVGAGHGRDPRRKPIIVAVTNLGGGDGVVLVDDGYGAQVEQAAKRRARVEIAAALLGIGQRQQHLSGGEAVGAQRFGPVAGQRDLADGGSGLALLQPQGAGGQAEHGAPERDRAGGDDEDIGAALVQLGEVLGQCSEPGMAQAAAAAVDQQAGADLDDDAAEIGELGRLHGSTALLRQSPCLLGKIPRL